MVSPSASRSTAASISTDCRSADATTASRIRACRSRIGSSNDSASRMRLYLVVNVGHRAQLLGLRFRTGVAEEVAAANLGSGQVLQQVRLAEWRMALDVKVES